MNELMLKTKTMSSREIAEFCNARHNDVIATIDRLFGKGLLRESRKTLREYISPNGGRPTMVYDLSKNDSLKVVSGYDDIVRSKVIDRWSELESHYEKNVVQEISLPKDYLSALKALVESEEAKQLAQEQLQIAAPKVQYFDMVADVNNYMNATTVGQKFGMSATVLNKHLEALDVYNRSIKQGRVFQQWFIDKGLGVMKKTENGYNQSRFTNKGEQWVIEKLTGEGVI